ncbi:MAG: transcription termination factor NusA [Candidatus Jacksonbacteria bacterium]
MLSPDLYKVIKQICEEKQISEESVVSTIELALAAAYRKDFADKLQNIKVKLEPQTGRFKVFDVKDVVEDVSPELKEEALKQARQKKKAALFIEDGHDDLFQDKIEGAEDIDLSDDKKLIEEGKVFLKFNPRIQITISDACAKKKTVKIGDQIEEKLEVPHDFGRMAAQTAKQVIIQRIREAERETVFSAYKSQEGEMVSGTIQRIEGSVVMVDIGKVNAILPYREQIPGEKYRIGQRLKVIILTVEMGTKGPEVIVSRTHKELVNALFELEVPEMETGTIEIKEIAREAGSRSKIAVAAHEENIDPIGSCVGQRGARVTAVIDELGGEKIDIIEWNQDSERFIAAALSPAKVDKVEILNEKAKTAKVIVKEDQQSLAIGKGGQNVRLAAKLTGWKIDIVQAGKVGQEGEGDEKVDESEKAGEEKKEEKLKSKNSTQPFAKGWVKTTTKNLKPKKLKKEAESKRLEKAEEPEEKKEKKEELSESVEPAEAEEKKGEGN